MLVIIVVQLLAKTRVIMYRTKKIWMDLRHAHALQASPDVKLEQISQDLDEFFAWLRYADTNMLALRTFAQHFLNYWMKMKTM